MAATLITVDCKLFQMMPYIIILKVRKFHQPTANRFSTARKKPVGRGTMCLPPQPEQTKQKKANETYVFLSPFGILLQSLTDFEQIFREIWQREDPKNAVF